MTVSLPVSRSRLNRRAIPLVLLIAAASILPASAKSTGLTAHAGNPYPAEDMPGVSLQREIVRLKSLDTLSTLDLLFEMRNTDPDYKSLEVITPVRIYLDEFRPDQRPEMMKRLSQYFPDLFGDAEEFADVRASIRARFGKRLFVRRFLSPIDLAKLGVSLTMKRGDDVLEASKIMIEFRWESPTQANLNAESPGETLHDVLIMDIRFFHEWLFKPDETVEFRSRLRMPTLVCGANDRYAYLPFHLAYADRWNGPIGKVYLVNDALEGTIAMPKILAFEQYQVGLSEVMTVLSAYEPKRSDRIAWYRADAAEGTCAGSPGSRDRYYYPAGIGEVSASSFIDRDKSLDGYFLQGVSSVSSTSRFPDYQHDLGKAPELLASGLESVSYANPLAERTAGDCDGDPAGTVLKNYCHPMFAFDMSRPLDPNRPEADAFYLKTAWCESAAGTGAGQHISFELKQPVRAMHIQNGYQISEERYTLNSRMRSIELRADDGSFKQPFAVSDLKILNLYEIDLPAGRYTLEIKRSFAGQYPVTCISALQFDFLSGDDWFDTRYPVF